MKINISLTGPHRDRILRNTIQLIYYCLMDLGHNVFITNNSIMNDCFNLITDPFELVGRFAKASNLLLEGSYSYALLDFECFNASPMGFNFNPLSSEAANLYCHLIGRSKGVWTPFIDSYNEYKKLTDNVSLYRFAYHERLNEIPKNNNKLIDVFFFGALHQPGRVDVLNSLIHAGLNVQHHDIYRSDLERTSFIAQSHVNLNLNHAAPFRHVSSRPVYLANNGICSISTPIEDPDGYLDYAVCHSPEEIVSGCLDWIFSGRGVKEGERVYEALKLNPGVPWFEAALDQTFSSK